MRFFLFGHGKMGTRIADLAQKHGYQHVNDLSQAQVCIDFSHADVVVSHVKAACEAKIPIVIGTTGWNPQLKEVKDLIDKHQNAGIYSPNFSIGVARFLKLLHLAKDLFADYEKGGVEYHHKDKKDAPSGTALAIERVLQLKNLFTSVRCGSFVGKHEVIFDSPSDTITLSHDAKNRDGFALGALKAAEWILDKKGWFTLDDMLHSLDHSF